MLSKVFVQVWLLQVGMEFDLIDDGFVFRSGKNLLKILNTEIGYTDILR